MKKDNKDKLSEAIMPPSEKEMAKRRKTRKYNVHEEFFDEFNEYSIYVLGYLYARGTILKEAKGGEMLKITSMNLEHLIVIANIMSCEYPIKQKGNSYSITINSKRLVRILDALGLKQRKFDNMKFPEFIPLTLQRHFVRGYFDGKGTYIPDAERRIIVNFSCGSEAFIEGLRDALVVMGLSRAKVRQNGKDGASNIVRYYVKDTRKLYYLMYNRSRIYCKLKKQKYDEQLRILNTIERKKYMTGRA